jgi:hypothetical protein
MNLREISIGNFVGVNDEAVKVVAIISKENGGAEVKDRYGNIQFVSIDNLQPIVLSNELLTNSCLFDKSGKYVLGVDHHRYYLKFKDGYIVLLSLDNQPIIHFWDVQQLHQLQNLYFALKGKEMTVIIGL